MELSNGPPRSVPPLVLPLASTKNLDSRSRNRFGRFSWHQPGGKSHFSCAIALKSMGPAITYRPYEEPNDYEQVVAMCKNDSVGRDYVPRVLNALNADPHCRPRVAVVGTNVVAFCNVRLLASDDEHQRVVFLEGVRVGEAVRRQGFGRYIVDQTLQTSLSDAAQNGLAPLDRQVRFLSSTIDANIGMKRIFEQTGWAARARTSIWPSFSTLMAVRESGLDTKGGLLKALDISHLVPQHARQTIPLWVQTRCPNDILHTMQELRHLGTSYLLPLYYTVDTAVGASKFLHSEYSESEQRSVWKLQRQKKPPILLFMQVHNKTPSSAVLCPVLSACVVDLEGAECCAAFAGTRPELGIFRMVFDPAISREDIKASPLLSSTETSEYIVYETRR